MPRRTRGNKLRSRVLPPSTPGEKIILAPVQPVGKAIDRSKRDIMIKEQLQLNKPAVIDGKYQVI